MYKNKNEEGIEILQQSLDKIEVGRLSHQSEVRNLLLVNNIETKPTEMLTQHSASLDS